MILLIAFLILFVNMVLRWLWSDIGIEGTGLGRVGLAAFAALFMAMTIHHFSAPPAISALRQRSVVVYSFYLIFAAGVGLLASGVTQLYAEDLMFFSAFAFLLGTSDIDRNKKGGDPGLLLDFISVGLLLASGLLLLSSYKYSRIGLGRQDFASGEVAAVMQPVQMMAIVLSTIGAFSRARYFVCGLVGLGSYAFAALMGEFRGGLIIAFVVAVVSSLLFIFCNSCVSRAAKAMILGSLLIVGTIAVSRYSATITERMTIFQIRLMSIDKASGTASPLQSLLSDSRFTELSYASQKIGAIGYLKGGGFGATYYDDSGFFDDTHPERSIIHVNYAHIPFKIGIMGLILLFIILINKVRVVWTRSDRRARAAHLLLLVTLLFDNMYYGIKEFGLAQYMLCLGVGYVGIWTMPSLQKPVPSRRSPGRMSP